MKALRSFVGGGEAGFRHFVHATIGGVLVAAIFLGWSSGRPWWADSLLLLGLMFLVEGAYRFGIAETAHRGAVGKRSGGH